MIELIKLWLTIGFISTTIYFTCSYISLKQLKEEGSTWGDVFKMFILMVLAGPFTAVMAFAGLFSITQDIKPALSMPLIITTIVLFVGGLVTECTAPREGAHCRDGTYSYATGRGACSWHGGVSSWDKDYWWETD